MSEPLSTDDLAYWRGQVDTRLHTIETLVAANSTYISEVKATLETTLKRTHEDVCLELRRMHDLQIAQRLLSARLSGGLAVLLVVLNLVVPLLVKLWK